MNQFRKKIEKKNNKLSDSEVVASASHHRNKIKTITT